MSRLKKKGADIKRYKEGSRKNKESRVKNQANVKRTKKERTH